MQLELTFGPMRPSKQEPAVEWLRVGCRNIHVLLVRNWRARRYVLRLRADDVARVTIPRGGSAVEARKFAERNVPWLEKEFLRRSMAPRVSRAWLLGSEILFRGEPVRVEAVANGESTHIGFGGQELRVRDPAADLRPEIENYLWNLAVAELNSRVAALANLHQLPVRRVSVRNQKSRWGSCSRRGTICLNWRLVQAPEFVRDYIILHELAHLKEMNHSRRFWKEVTRLCPGYEAAEAWLRKNSRLLR
jgi:predicted metal-dependent hydrolase